MAQFAFRVLLYSLSGIALLFGWRGSSGSFFCTWIAVTCAWALIEFVAMKQRWHSMPFLFRLFVSYALTVLVLCCILLSNLGTPVASDADSTLEASSGVIRTISVVLPCANESFVDRTVRAIWETTPREELLEIIIVDDVTSQLSPRFLSSQLRIIRQVPAAGLIRSKQKGADAARGDAIIFLDCHVRPMPNWTVALLSELRANPRRIAVPLITGLDPDTWEELSPHEGGKKMCITWSVDFFWCNELPGSEVPILSGGLLAISRHWWHESGGYDPSMRSWGGENIDQSLRTWLCGGEIVYAEGSRVAHMWRDPGNPKTMLHYAIPERDVLRNRLRAASAWMGPWIQKVQTFQEFHSIETGSLDHFDHVKRRLNCGTFQDYLRRFEDLFVGTGMLPSTIFHLKDTNGRCLTLDLYTKQLYLHDCIEDFEGQVWQRSNSISSEDLQCCGGLKLWNYNYCLAWYGADVQVAGCSFFGGSSYQDFGLGITETGEAMIGAPSLEGEQHCLSSGTLVSGVSLEVHLNHSLATLELVGPGIFRVVTKSRLCLVSLEGHLGLAFGSCASAAELQVVGESEGRKQLQVTKVEGRGQCLDAAQGTGIYLYPCHSPEERLPNQVFIAEEGGPLCWPFGDAEDRGQSNHLRCVSERREEPQVVLQPCANEAGHEENDKGQLFLKHLERTRESFTLSSLERDKCLVADFEHSVTVNGEEAFFLVMGTCSKSQRWVQTETAVAVELRGDLWCLAASDFRRPVVTSCWPDDLTQHFETQRVPNNRGISYFAVRKRPHWADSGRERFPALCLDVTPSPRIPVIAAPCKEQALWTMEWEEVPLETQLFEASESER